MSTDNDEIFLDIESNGCFPPIRFVGNIYRWTQANNCFCRKYASS